MTYGMQQGGMAYGMQGYGLRHEGVWHTVCRGVAYGMQGCGLRHAGVWPTACRGVTYRICCRYDDVVQKILSREAEAKVPRPPPAFVFTPPFSLLALFGVWLMMRCTHGSQHFGYWLEARLAGTGREKWQTTRESSERAAVQRAAAAR